MPLQWTSDGTVARWEVRKIGVIGPGIVGMPMAAMLAHARVRIGQEAPARVVVIQRDSPTSGWKVGAINRGESPIGGVEPDLDRIVAEGAREGLLSASHHVEDLRDADVVLVCVQTDKRGLAPDYGPLMEALEGLARAFQARPEGQVPLVVFESTLAPSTMATVIRDHFRRFGLEDGRDVLLGNSPNRVMPGRLVERVRTSDKIVAGLHPETPRLIQRLYGHIVTEGRLHPTSSLTAEVVKTLENAYRDVRIAYAAEVARWCDARDIDFFALRDRVNEVLGQADEASRNPTAVPVGGLLVPTLGVGGHCLPKDGILLWWRRLEAGDPGEKSLILEARRVNDESPAATLSLAERALGPLDGRPVALLGVAYRFDSEDTRNSPTLVLGNLLRRKGCAVRLADPYVRPGDQNLVRSGLDAAFTNDRGRALEGAEVAFLCTGHGVYARDLGAMLDEGAPTLAGIVDACNLASRGEVESRGLVYAGIGRGRRPPPSGLVDAVVGGFRAVERGVAREVQGLCDFLNARYAATPFEAVRFPDVQALARTCSTGCMLADPVPPDPVPGWEDLRSRLVEHALA
ncbi:MAG TPA: nucleotide sugar dehydrogenase [Myxococcota bacterium]|nr:nucleotide sugar dehydrogenase [Myxococcota bacterium]HQK51113.1 nucleotide sugar dehydrogenase [Myxococcota bacterium]